MKQYFWLFLTQAQKCFKKHKPGLLRRAKHSTFKTTTNSHLYAPTAIYYNSMQLLSRRWICSKRHSHSHIWAISLPSQLDNSNGLTSTVLGDRGNMRHFLSSQQESWGWSTRSHSQEPDCRTKDNIWEPFYESKCFIIDRDHLLGKHTYTATSEVWHQDLVCSFHWEYIATKLIKTINYIAIDILYFTVCIATGE